MIVAMHLLTIRHGEVYLHHGWLLIIVAFLVLVASTPSRWK